MSTACRCAAACAVALGAAAPALASQIDHFQADATQVRVGDVVHFDAQISLEAYFSSFGGSNPVEPPPEEGPQTWDINWYGYDQSALVSTWLSAGGEHLDRYLGLAPDVDYTGSWSFALQFDTAGVYEIVLDGGWTYDYAYYYSGESAYRDCWYDDPDNQTGLQCSPWTYEYTDDSWTDTYDESFAPRSLTITVLAVPEPASWLLALAGGLGLRLARRGRIRAAIEPA